MAESIVFGMAHTILSSLNSHAVQGTAAAIGVQQDLKKLQRTLSTVNDVLKDADEQQLIMNHELSGWVKNIKEACYEAEDVLDEFATEALRRELVIRGTTFKKVRSFAYFVRSVLFRFKMSRKIKKIRQNFDDIEADKNKFHLPTRIVHMGVQNRWREQNHSFVEESEVFGRESDKNMIINMLSGGDEKSAIAITGMGGLGKTTLAQLVYNDKVVEASFELRMWVGVYQDFDVKNILEKILKSATNNGCPDLEMDQLRSRLQELVRGKRFLLVLDDVWNEDSEKWDKLKFLMSSSARGSKVIITTRNAKVATVMGAEMYTLKELSSDNCWNVFEQRAFARGQEQPDTYMVVIGKEIVNRCRGVPLAVKTLGSLMRLETTQREWETVRDSDIWRLLPQTENGIMPALKLSYNHLPILLKQCFAYLASYPMHSLYKKNYLIQSWIAHGFVCLSPGDRSSLEDVGNEYVKELLWRSLIQEPEEDIFGNLISFTVHDLVHNLAKDVLGSEFILFEGIKVLKPEEIRYADLLKCSDSEVKEVLCSMPNLRELDVECTFPVADIFASLKRLRLLRICVTNELFLSSIGKLKHLRLLAVLSDDIQTVPNSITNLLNLQTFHLSFCPKLRELPKDIRRMINLRHIIIEEGAPMSYMPLGLRNLTSLRTLTVFFVGDGVGCKLNELHPLMHLEGHLTIKDLENVRDARDCAEVNLKGKKGLESLKFLWNSRNSDEDVSRERSVEVLENLQPHSNLKILEIEGYMGSRFASWMRKSMFPKLLEVSLLECENVESLYSIGEFPLLKDLWLENMGTLKCVEGGGGSERGEWFSSLKKLILVNLGTLESFGFNESSGALSSLPSLVELTIIGCPRLGNMPQLPSLERLQVNCCGEKLVHSLLMLPKGKLATSASISHLISLKIEECSGLISLPENWLRVMVSLEELVIKNCSSLVSLEDEGLPHDMGYFTSLTPLEISGLAIVTLPQWIRNLTKLQKLSIEACADLIVVPEWFWELTSLRELGILCQNLKSLPNGMQHLTALESLTIAGCVNLTSWPNGLGGLVSLEHLVITCSPTLPCLPEQLQQLTGLRFLAIFNCQTMLALPEWLQNFTSLQSFGISTLRNLQCLPDWFPKLTALGLLNIWNCDELTSRCQKGGIDWPKIAHVPDINLNFEYIQRSEYCPIEVKPLLRV